MFSALNNATSSALGLVRNTVRGVSSIVRAPFESGSDSSSVSNESRLLSSLSGDTAQSIAGSGKRMNIRQLRQMMQEKAESLQKKLAEICRKNNISTKGNFTLNVDEDGKIIIKGEHNQKQELEKLLNADSTFVQDFKDAKLLSDFFVQLQKSRN